MSFPTGVATTTVTGKYLDALGDPVDGTLRFEPTVTIKHPSSNTVFTGQQWAVDLKGDGTFSIELPVCQTDLVPNTFLYTVTEVFPGMDERVYNIRLDESLGSQVNLVSLSPAAPPTVVDIYPTLGDVASVAAGLDQNIYDQLAVVNTHLSTLDGQLGVTLTDSDISVLIPPLILGKIPAQYVPAVPQGSYYQVASQAAMLALAAVRGDFALRTDTSTTFVLSQDDPTVLGHWLQLPSGGAVNSVNGKTGVVSLSYLDVNAASASHTHNSLSLSSLSSLAGTINTLGVITLTAGGSTSLRTVLDANGIKNFDSSALVWQQDIDSTKVSTWFGSKINSVAAGQTLGGLSIDPVTYATVAANTTRTVTVIKTSDPADASYGVIHTTTGDWNSTLSNYTALNYQIDTATITIGGGNKKAQSKVQPDGFTWTLTNSAGSTALMSLTNSGVSGGQLNLGMTSISFTGAGDMTSSGSNIKLGTVTTASPLYYANLLKVGVDNFEARDTLDALGNKASVLIKNSVEAARTSLTPAGVLSVVTPTSNRAVVLENDTGVITATTGFAVTLNWTIASVRYRVRNGIASIVLTVNSTFTVGAGNIANVQIFTATPAVIHPTGPYESLQSAGAGPLCSGGIFSDGTVALFATDDGPANYAIGTGFSLAATYMI